MTRDLKRLQDHRQWLFQALPQHERLATGVKPLLEGMLKKKAIEYLSVSSRIKDLDEALNKIDRKKYQDPENQLTDLSGIRVITYLEEHVGQISAVIEELFEVDKLNSLDRTEILCDDKVGYRSTHFVCTLGSKRSCLPENEALGDLKFEIQVRTVLQHAWAELAHDRSFKFGTALPTKIQRKLNLYSGMLEIVDNAFDEIAKEIDVYAKSINSTPLEQISEAEIDSISVDRYLDEISKAHGIKLDKAEIPGIVFEELKNFGLQTIGDLKKITTEGNLELIKKEGGLNGTGFRRSVMMFHDLDRYLKSPFGWTMISENGALALAQHYGIEKIARAFSQHDVCVDNEYDDEYEEEKEEEEENRKPASSFAEIKELLQQKMLDELE